MPAGVPVATVGVGNARNAGLLAVRPRPGSELASVGIVGGSGLAGCRLTDRRPYLTPGVAYPDVTVLRDLGPMLRGRDLRLAMRDEPLVAREPQGGEIVERRRIEELEDELARERRLREKLQKHVPESVLAGILAADGGG